MNHHLSAAAVTSAFYLLYIAMTATADPPYSHNITAILAEDPRFSTFNHHLTSTGLADVINNLTEVTVCAMDNAAMEELLSLNPSPASLRRLLLFHLFSHYSDAEYLNSCCAWTLYPRPSGVGNEVVDLMEIDGKVSFTFPFTSDYSQLLGFIELVPPNISVLHVSNVLPSPEAWSLKSPIDSLKIMTESGCGAFAGAVAEVSAADRFLRENAYVGMTVLCPIDGAWERFSPRFRQMTEEEKVDLLLFHAIPVYHRRCEFIGEIGEWRLSTLTSYYRGNGGIGEPTVKMEAVRKLMIGVGYDDEGPLAVYPIRGVLLPDDPVGVMEYLSPVEVPVKAAMDEDCVDPVFFAMPPAPEPSEVADSDLVENIASLQLAS